MFDQDKLGYRALIRFETTQLLSAHSGLTGTSLFVIIIIVKNVVKHEEIWNMENIYRPPQFVISPSVEPEQVQIRVFFRERTARQPGGAGYVVCCDLTAVPVCNVIIVMRGGRADPGPRQYLAGGDQWPDLPQSAGALQPGERGPAPP